MREPDAVFERVGDGETFVGTALSAGPWDPGAMHGGAPAALLARAVERHDPDLPGFVARLSVELLRPVPVGQPLAMRTRTIRPGRRVAMVEAVCSVEGTDVASARALLIRRDDVGIPDDLLSSETLALSPDQSTGVDLVWPADSDDTVEFEVPGFALAVEFRSAGGSFEEHGPATVWFRLRVPVVDGEPTTPFMRVAAAADFGNGISRILDGERYLFINPDLTVALHRYPEGDWVALDAVTLLGSDGVGQSESALYDERGRIGRSLQSLLIDAR